MTPPNFNGSFAHRYRAEILPRRPLILPGRNYVYPAEVEEVERGALEVLVQPAEGAPFLATCALGFRDPAAPTGLWSMPHPEWICAVSGGYGYLIDVGKPERFLHLRYRPVLAVLPVPSQPAQNGVDAAQSFSRTAQSGWNHSQSPADPVQSQSRKAQSVQEGLLLFAGHHSVLAWGREGEAWESERLSDEGLTGLRIEGRTLHGEGWEMRTDREVAFALDLNTGRRR